LKKLFDFVVGYLDSSGHARRVLAVYWVLLLISTHTPELGMGEDANQFGMFQVDKGLHVLAFGGLMYLLWRAGLAGERASLLLNALVAVSVAVVYAVVDEYTQGWVGREVSVSDVVAGLIGIVGVFLIITAGPPGDRVRRGTVAIRYLAVAMIVLFIFSALVPLSKDWLHWFVQRVYRPWPGFDKAGHFYMSVALTLLLSVSLPGGVHRPRLGIFLTILAVGLSGPIIETAQSFTGRSVDMADLYAHQVGLLAGMLGLAVLAVGRELRMRHRERSQHDG
jgi:VanZ family protein